LQIWACAVFRVDTEITRRAGHDLGEAISSDWAFRPDYEAAFLPDQRLEKRAPLDDGEAGRGDPGPPIGFLCDADDELFNILGGIAEHLIAGRVGIDIRCPIDRFGRAVDIPATAFEIRDHAADCSAFEARLRVEDRIENRELFAFDGRDLLFDSQCLALHRKV